MLSSWGKGGIPNAGRKTKKIAKKTKKDAQLIYLYNLNQVPDPASFEASGRIAVDFSSSRARL